MFIISQLWLTSHPRNTVVLLDTGTDTSREIYSEDADDRTQTRNPSVINQGGHKPGNMENLENSEFEKL